MVGKKKNTLVLFHVLPLRTTSILFINNFSDLKNISINILVFNRWSRGEAIHLLSNGPGSSPYEPPAISELIDM